MKPFVIIVSVIVMLAGNTAMAKEKYQHDGYHHRHHHDGAMTDKYRPNKSMKHQQRHWKKHQRKHHNKHHSRHHGNRFYWSSHGVWNKHYSSNLRHHRRYAHNRHHKHDRYCRVSRRSGHDHRAAYLVGGAVIGALINEHYGQSYNY